MGQAVEEGLRGMRVMNSPRCFHYSQAVEEGLRGMYRGRFEEEKRLLALARTLLRTRAGEHLE